MYYIWESRIRATGDVIIPNTIPDPVADSLLSARRIETAWIEMELRFKPHRSFRIGDDAIVRGWRAILHSERLADVLRDVGVDGIDYHSCRLVDRRDGTTYRTHAVANLLDAIFCLDREESVLDLDTEEPSQIWSVDSLKLRTEHLGDSLMFRLGERPALVIVHERVKEAVARAGLVGPVFLPAEGYRDYAYCSGENRLHVLGTHDDDPDGAADAGAEAA